MSFIDNVLAGATGQNSEYVFRGLDYILATANMYGIRVRNIPPGCFPSCMHANPQEKAHVVLRCMPHRAVQSFLLCGYMNLHMHALQAIVVPVNNWLEPGVGDGKQQVSSNPPAGHNSLPQL